jgi:fluoroquinolone transport system permease protein
MSRLAATLRLDVRQQARQHFYVVSVLVVLSCVAVARLLLGPELTRLFLPVFFLGAISGTTWMFVGSLVLLERADNVLAGLWVTPLRLNEYFLSKTISLSALAVAESAALTLLGYGVHLHWPLLLLGLIAMSVVYNLAGLAIVARHVEVTDFLIPSVAVLGVAQINFLDYFEVVPAPWRYVFYLWPTQGPLLLLEAAFYPVAWGELVYAVVASTAFIVAFWCWARRAFRRHLIEGGGL